MLLCGFTDKDLCRICRNQYEHPGSAIGYWPETCLGHVYIVLEPVGSARLIILMTVILWVYMFWCTEGCSESRMWSRAWRGVSKWSRHKYRYIGRPICYLIYGNDLFRRSPVAVTSSTSSPRRRADETLPRALLDREFTGRHRVERVLNAEVSYVRYWESVHREDVWLHQLCCHNASA